MHEGKNNEIRNLCATINLKVNRIIRIEYCLNLKTYYPEK
jgi:16S rRNA U516 pseudouridylate synthase RsuA-like enzyme